MDKHTPEPWEINERDLQVWGAIGVDADGKPCGTQVCKLSDVAEIDLNAALILTAPRLLRVLREFCEAHQTFNPRDPVSAKRMAAAVIEARATIEAATDEHAIPEFEPDSER